MRVQASIFILMASLLLQLLPVSPSYAAAAAATAVTNTASHITSPATASKTASRPSLLTPGPPPPYAPNWPSLMTRPLPSWYDQAKVGIFLHWGVFSVPSYGGRMPSEWYWHSLRGGFSGCCGTKVDPLISAYHNRTYGADTPYTALMPQFTAELFDPDAWASLFAAAGLKYVVMTTKHHEGFTMWCSEQAYNWNACAGGPKRDLVGALAKAVRARGLRFGAYLSMFEWYHPLYLADLKANFTTSRYVDEVYIPQARDLVSRYAPDLIWSDGDFGNTSWWRAPEFVAWLYNQGPNREDVVVNDRWGSDNPPIESGRHFGGYFSGADRQAAMPEMLKHKWESAFTIDAHNWGYARNTDINGYLNTSAMLRHIAATVAYGGNVLVNVGPTSDGLITPIFQERLLALGAWLATNGEAVYNSTVWRVQNDTAAGNVYYTTVAVTSTDKSSTGTTSDSAGTIGGGGGGSSGGGGGGGIVYAFVCAGWPGPGGQIVLREPLMAGADAQVQLLGHKGTLKWQVGAGSSAGLSITAPALSPGEMPSEHGPWVFKLTGWQ